MNDTGESSAARIGGIVLCGGHSSRMGSSKADLQFGDQSLLARVTAVVAQVVSPIAIVSAYGQQLPTLPALSCDVLLTHDRRESRGPLEGIAAGMSKLEGKADAVYVTACDVPFLNPEFVREMVGELRPETEIVVPRCERFHHPLSAVYRMSCLPTIQRMLAEELLSPVYLFDQVATREISTETLQSVDPELLSLRSVNTPEEYQAALVQCGLNLK